MSTQAIADVPQVVQVKPKTQGQLAVQMDELWSFVNDKGNKQWVWQAKRMSQPVRLSVVRSAIVLGMLQGHYGHRCHRRYRQCAVIYTDYWQAYETALRSPTSESRRQGKWIDQLHRTIQ